MSDIITTPGGEFRELQALRKQADAMLWDIGRMGIAPIGYEEGGLELAWADCLKLAPNLASAISLMQSVATVWKLGHFMTPHLWRRYNHPLVVGRLLHGDAPLGRILAGPTLRRVTRQRTWGDDGPTARALHLERDGERVASVTYSGEEEAPVVRILDPIDATLLGVVYPWRDDLRCPGFNREREPILRKWEVFLEQAAKAL